METVILVGGPKSGETIAIRGGDSLRFPEAEPTPAYLDLSVKNEPVQITNCLYVRRDDDRRFFEYRGKE